ncbi:MAG: hypothetical protein ACYTKC_06860 [Planctomycetota bacterium]|jgi:hypothetical protein
MQPFSTHFCAVVVLVLVSGLTAQHTRVVPAENSTLEGSTGSIYPFANVYGRSQQVWKASAVTSSVALLKSIGYRIDSNIGSAVPSRTYTNATMSLGKTAVAPDNMSAIFANNITHTMTKILDANKLVLPAQPIPTSVPAAFNINIEWTTPFVFVNGAENLLLDMILPGSPAKSQYVVDAEFTDAASSGSVVHFGTGGSFSSPEMFSMYADESKLKPGGTLNLTCGTFRNAYLGSLIVGLSSSNWSGYSLPLDLSFLGAPRNSLYVSMDLTLPFNTAPGGFGTHRSNLNTPIPNETIYKGLKFYTQAYYADGKANGAGLVTTGALKLTTADASAAAAASHLIGNRDYQGTSGSSPFGGSRFAGPVVQFKGILP